MKSEKSKKFLSRVGFYGLLLFFALLRAVASYVFIVPQFLDEAKKYYKNIERQEQMAERNASNSR